jgi:hypothetical protein
MLKKFFFGLLLSISISQIAFAIEGVIGRKIVHVGCNAYDGTCFIKLNGSAIGSTLKCLVGETNEFRFDSSTTVGRRTYASLYGAFIAKKTVDVHLDGCFDNKPTLVWFHIY